MEPDWLNNILATEELRAIAVALVITGLTAIAGRIFAARPRIQWGVTNNNHFILPLPNGQLLSTYVRNITVANQGRKVAENVEVVLNFEPQHLEHFPHLPITETKNKDGRHVVTIARLNPKEFVNFSMLSANGELPLVTYVRCSGYSAKQVNIAPQRVAPKWFIAVALLLILIGFITTIYFVALFFV